MTNLASQIKCKHCGCTQQRACVVDGEPCAWVIFCGLPARLIGCGPDEMPDPDQPLDMADNVCSNPDCVEKEYAALTAEMRMDRQGGRHGLVG